MLEAKQCEMREESDAIRDHVLLARSKLAYWVGVGGCNSGVSNARSLVQEL